MLNAHLLAMLKGWSAYGYELVQRLNDSGLGDYNKGTIYRALRQMEQLGLVSSMWDTSASGPARRMYSLTVPGTLFLKNWLALLDVHRSMLERFIEAGQQASRQGEAETRDPDGEATHR
ncbi:MAG: helix-turn-helix transcriptional regulator [Gammaproteobacteria bacterium]